MSTATMDNVRDTFEAIGAVHIPHDSNIAPEAYNSILAACGFDCHTGQSASQSRGR